MNTFYIARHGETENNRAKRVSGWVDTPLTDTGLKPAERVIAKLADARIDSLYSSDMGRAFITAYVIARGLGYADEIQRLAGLREVSYGEAANMPSAEAYRQYPLLDRDTRYVPPGGESLEHMQQRVFATLREVDANHTDENILLVCHSGVMAALRAQHLGDDFGQHNISEAYPHDYVARFSLSDGDVTFWQEVA